jgi:LmbE family N-acetylglucosaminyl deacetylase
MNFNHVLCLSPHPDDVEYSMSGTIVKNKDTVFHILCLSNGGDCDSTTSYLRYNEMINSWKVTNIDNYNLIKSNVEFIKDKQTDEWIQYIETECLAKLDIDAILLPSSIDSHFEHVLVSSFGNALARIKPYSLIEYKSPSALENWNANLFMDISEVYETKKNMLLEFKSQLSKTYFTEDTIDGYHTHFQCSKKGLKKVEQFKINTSYHK